MNKPQTDKHRPPKRLKSFSPQPGPTHEEIARRAYEIYLRAGCQNGKAVEQWLAAERELNDEYAARADSND